MKVINNYNLFFEFIDAFLPGGFTEIDQQNPVLQKIEKMTEANDQFFFISDLLKVKILYTSQRSIEMIGIKSKDVDPLVLFTLTHPDDLLRHNIARTKLFNLGQQLFIENHGKSIISTNLRYNNAQGEYRNIMVQCYLFFSDIPYKTVFMLQVMTDISWFKKIKHGYHYYTGKDLSIFRFPTEDILVKGNIFTDCEFKILQLLAMGLSTEEIATRLYKSISTISTHRRNILKKTGNHSTQELILDLKARGFI
jgi:DNA-binding CsgD family transcriptional regulator